MSCHPASSCDLSITEGCASFARRDECEHLVNDRLWRALDGFDASFDFVGRHVGDVEPNFFGLGEKALVFEGRLKGGAKRSKPICRYLRRRGEGTPLRPEAIDKLKRLPLFIVGCKVHHVGDARQIRVVARRHLQDHLEFATLKITPVLRLQCG